MKILFKNIIETVSATNENDNFPVENIRDIHSKKRFKSTSISSTITLTMGGGSNALALYNVQADSIVLSGAVSKTIDLTRDDGYGEYTAPSVFIEYPEESTVHTIYATLSTTTSDIVTCGIAYGGKAYTFKNPDWGLGNKSISHSIIYDLDNGFEYIFQRNLSETPSFSFRTSDRAEYWNLLRLLKTTYPHPIVLKIDELEESEQHNAIWYARLTSEPSGTLSSFNDYSISFELKEFL